VSKPKPKQAEQKKATGAIPPATPLTAKPILFSIKRPMLLLALAALIVYIPTLFFNYTELDDTIFIHDFQAYNENMHNIITAFQRGLFDAVKDPYYRPLFSDAMIINYHLSGIENVWGYHLVNILLHVTTVVLLFKLFRKLNIKELHAFILTMIFAVHPVLSQAVAWIPGRNDTMLAIFVVSFLIFAIDYSNSGKLKYLFLSGLFLLLAFFTKETAVFAAPAAFILLVFVMNKKPAERNNVVQYALWIACFGIWYAARAMATTASAGLTSAHALNESLHRLPVIVQYIGKIFLPLNLSVFPIQEDTVYYYGIAAIAILIAILMLNKQRNTKIIFSGIAIFLLFLMPAILVPSNLNEQTFEHRLYLPMIGMLLLLSQTVLFNKNLADKQLLTYAITACGLLAMINFYHQRSFADPRTFWTAAVETSPHSAFANMMLAARLDKDEVPRSEALFRKAYSLNPREKYLNFYMAEMLQNTNNKDSVAASEKYLLVEKQVSDYFKCDFLLARVLMERNDFKGAADCLQTYLKRDPTNPMANNNLLLLYMQTQQADKAKAHAKQMQQLGLAVPPGILKQLGM
jgi:4-amino-4-deoxy-L-arabinose transferase-like glycosyltransferase